MKIEGNISMLKLTNQRNEGLQPMTFSDVVEEIKRLSTDEKREIQLLLQQYLREERRNEIYDNVELTQAEHQNGNLAFSANIQDLKRLIEE
jgi:hypothetical protein